MANLLSTPVEYFCCLPNCLLDFPLAGIKGRAPCFLLNVVPFTSTKYFKKAVFITQFRGIKQTTWHFLWNFFNIL